MASVDSVLPWTGKAKRVSEAEKNKRNHFQCCKATISVHLNKSHFMRISSKLQQLNVDTRDEIYHRKLLFRFFNRTRYLILKRRASLLAVIDKNEGWKCRVVELDFLFSWMSEQLLKIQANDFAWNWPLVRAITEAHTNTWKIIFKAYSRQEILGNPVAFWDEGVIPTTWFMKWRNHSGHWN